MEKRKFNIIDFAVIAILIAVVAFAAIKISSSKANSQEQKERYKITFYTNESTTFSLEQIKKGEKVSDESNNTELGKITELDIDYDHSKTDVETSDGKIITTSRPGYGSGYITFTGDGVKYDHGAKFDGCQYSVGQTATIRAGISKVYGRIYKIEKIKD